MLGRESPGCTFAVDNYLLLSAINLMGFKFCNVVTHIVNQFKT